MPNPAQSLYNNELRNILIALPSSSLANRVIVFLRSRSGHVFLPKSYFAFDNSGNAHRHVHP